ncbi:hypothetical protein OROGR_012063 [Orobanche gracilis]
MGMSVLAGMALRAFMVALVLGTGMKQEMVYWISH